MTTPAKVNPLSYTVDAAGGLALGNPFLGRTRQVDPHNPDGARTSANASAVGQGLDERFARS